MGQRKKIFSNYSFIFACGLAFVGAGFAIGGLFVSKNNQVAQEALAADTVPYMAWDESSKSVKSVEGGCSEYTIVTDSTTSWTDGWYVVNSNVNISDLIEVSGTANLILCDNFELTATKGIGLTEGASIKIYAQSDGEDAGKLTVTGSGRAGIGPKYNVASGDITIHGGIITATGKSNGAGIGSGSHSSVGAITIHGGVITATGGADNAAGIGSGFDYDHEATVDTITINGGVITATGGERAAGIGGGSSGNGGTITINGGTITATGGADGNTGGAGIGGGNLCKSGTITINGGVITATGGEKAAGIGGGDWGVYENITINGGAITATGGRNGAGIGCGDGESCGNITISNQVTSLTATKGPDGNGNAIGRGNSGSCGTVTICGAEGEISDSPFTAQTITYHLNGGEFSGGFPGIYMTGAEVTLPTNITKENHIFVGWYDNLALTGDSVTAIGKDAIGNKEFWASWNPTVTFNTNGGTFATPAPTYYVEAEGLVLPTNITKTDYSFGGWWDNATFTGEPVAKILPGDSGAKSYYARWYPIGYYLVGSVTDGKVVEDYLMTKNTAVTDADEYYYEKKLTAGTTIKAIHGTVVYGGDGSVEDTYPTSGDSYTIPEDGFYRIYLRPNADGGDEIGRAHV